MKNLRIGSICTGTGALDMAVMDVFGGSMAWHCQYEPPDKHGREDKYQYAARILAHHWPTVPNHGDVTAVDWSTVDPVDIVTAGFPCTDISLAGRGEGIQEGNRSGLWFTIARAIGALRPGLVILENVRAIVNRRPGLDVVLSELARLGFHAEWICVRASDVGACHQRDRWFLLAWPANAHRPGLEGRGLRGATAELGVSVAYANDERGHGRGSRGAGRDEPAAHRGFAAYASCVGEREPSDQTLTVAGSVQARSVPGGRDGVATSNAESDGRDEGRAEPARLIGGPDAPLSGASTPSDPDGNLVRQQPVPECGSGGQAVAGLPRVERGTTADPDGSGWRPRPGQHDGQRPGERLAADIAWGPYERAVRRWEHIFGRPALRPTDDRGRLAPVFVEWMMGLPLGWVTEVSAPPGMTESGLRNARLKALGNGVVPMQAAYALRILRDRLTGEVAA